MKSHKFFTCLLVFLLCQFILNESRSEILTDNYKIKSEQYVLVINCQIESALWKGNYEDAIVRYLTSSKIADVYCEHIKALMINTDEDLDKELERLFAKYTVRPRAVVLIGPAAWTLFADAFNKKWSDVPFLRCIASEYTLNSLDRNAQNNVVRTDFTKLQQEFNVTGILTPTFVKENIDLMFKVLPDINHIVLVSDDRMGSYIIRYRLRKCMAQYFPQISTDYIVSTDCTTGKMLEKVASYDDRTAVLFHSWVMEGFSQEEHYITENAYKLIGNVAKCPVFTSWDINVAAGFTAGGYFIRMEDLSDMSVELLRQILSGKSPRDIPFTDMKDKGAAYLNYPNLMSYHLANLKYPSDAVYFDRPQSIYYVYRYQLIFGALVVLFVFLVLIQRFFNLKKLRNYERKEFENQQKIHQLVTLNNYKLALSLDVSSVIPWMWDIQNNQVYEDDVHKLMENPASSDVSEKVDFEQFLNRVQSEDKGRLQRLLFSLQNGKCNYAKDEFRLFEKVGEDKTNWYVIQAIVFERNNFGKPVKVIGTLMKTTESKELELELRKAKEKAEESNKLKSAFLTNLSHEIRTPLNAIVGFSGIIANSEDEDEKRELASIVQQNNKLLLKLVNDIMDISKIESDSAEFVFSNVDINSSLKDIVEVYSKRVNPDVTIEADYPMLDCYINTERKRLLQILDNFMSNAVKFTKQGSIHIGYYHPQEGMIRFYVKDTGCGIPQAQLKSVFGRFVKLNTFEQGTGLGLSVCQLLAEKLNGDIGVFSEYNKGSEFWVEIPYVKVGKEEFEAQKFIDSTPTSDKSLTVLIAEDSQINYSVLKNMLSRQYTLLHAWNGKEAVELFKRFHPNIVLMDVKMPILNGYEATAEIRKLDEKVPIIAVSAYAFEENMAEAGFTSYEPKPIDRNVLLRKIDDLLHLQKK